MLEIVVWSLFVGSLGVQTAAISGWMYWWQTVTEQQEQEEEEILTQYEAKESIAESTIEPKTSKSKSSSKSSKDPRLVGWEFKIVRARYDLFRDPSVLQRLCEEEAQAGWIMIEKLDDRRVRFKRPIAFRDVLNPDYLPHDPYRSHYGASWHPMNLLVAIASVMVMLLPAYLGYALVKQSLNNSIPEQIQTLPSLQKGIR